MKNVAPAVALLAGTALAGQAPSAVEAAGKPHPGGRGEIHIVPVNPMVIPDESVEQDVNEVVKMADKDLKKKLSDLYKETMTPLEKTFFPPNSVEAMQRRIKEGESKEEDQQLVTDVMNRYAMLLGDMLHSSYVFGELKSNMASKTSPAEYKDEARRLPIVMDSLERENMMLVAYLRRAANDLRTKTSMPRVQGVVKFLTDLAAMYETNQMRLHMEVELAKMRFKEDKAVELEKLQQEREFTETGNQLSVLSDEFKRKAGQAKASATDSVDNGVLAADYVTLVE
ncbi:hypothetical protein Emed_007101 [Eimeria media]